MTRAAAIPLGRLGGVRLTLDPLLPVVVLLLAASGAFGASFGRALLLLLGLLACVAVHEAGHALVARLRGLAVSGIHLHLLPVTYVERGRPADVLWVALAGPAANLLAAALLLGVRLAVRTPWPAPTWPAVEADPLLLAVAANLLMGGVNLLPVLPTDGGRALRALVESRRGARAARGTLAVLGLLAGLAALVVGLRRWGPESAWLAALGAWLLWAAVREARAARSAPPGTPGGAAAS